MRRLLEHSLSVRKDGQVCSSYDAPVPGFHSAEGIASIDPRDDGKPGPRLVVSVAENYLFRINNSAKNS